MAGATAMAMKMSVARTALRGLGLYFLPPWRIGRGLARPPRSPRPLSLQALVYSEGLPPAGGPACWEAWDYELEYGHSPVPHYGVERAV